MKEEYFFILGKDPQLSRAELSMWGEEIFFSAKNSYWRGCNLRWTNHRQLPKSREQILQDSLGGVVRLGHVESIAQNTDDLWAMIQDILQQQAGDRTFSVGLSSLDERIDLQSWLARLCKFFQNNINHRWRLINRNADNLSSADIFQAKLLKKGMELVIVPMGKQYGLGRTLANQNLRNYDLRDHRKPWRDSQMGMLPPRLAQILLNLALGKNPKPSTIIWDPFCGSGTINLEAGILGYETIGSDHDTLAISGAKKNWHWVVEKFRLEGVAGDFFSSDILDCDPPPKSTVMATEGWLGENFTSAPTSEQIANNAEIITSLWRQIFDKNWNITRLVACVPVWKQDKTDISIYSNVMELAYEHGYKSIFEPDKKYTYARPGAWVGREIIALERY